MGRSVKKGPFTDTHLEAKLAVLAATNEKKVVRNTIRAASAFRPRIRSTTSRAFCGEIRRYLPSALT